MISMVLTLVLLMATQVHAQTDSLRGRWGGTIVQEIHEPKDSLKPKPDDQTKKLYGYTMSVDLTQLLEHEKSAEVWYPDLGCTTEWTFIHFADGVYKFWEQPVKTKKGTCVASVVTVAPKERNRIGVAWYMPGATKPVASGTRSRLEPVESKDPNKQ
jgi:hypothetical protein